MVKTLNPQSIRGESIEEVDSYIGTLEGSQPLAKLPKPFKQRFTHCWRLPVVFSDQPRNLLVLIDSDFPFSLPRIAVENSPPLLDWPHLERHGLLCVLPDMASSAYRQARQVVQSVLADACSLIEHNIHGDTEQELRDEFLSYWNFACADNARSCVSIANPVGPSREIAVWKGKRLWYFADSHDDLHKWLDNRLGPSDERQYETEPAWLIWRNEPWLPSEYPKTAADLLTILSDEGAAFPRERIVEDAVDGISVLVGAPTDNGVCFAALIHRPPGRSRLGPTRRGADYQTKGFRRGRVPRDVQLKRAFSAGAAVQKCDVSRADSAWIHGRDQDARHELLKGRRVAVVGCGSLGSEVVTMISKAGVGSITIVDGELLAWANIGRHSLGASSVWLNKAEAMKSMLAKTLPHVRVDAVGSRLGLQDKALVEKIMSADIIVSATGSWSAASLLNVQWLDTANAPDMIVTWMEAHALAAHSVHLSKLHASGCLQCGYNATGTPRLEVTEWQNDPTLKVPACGGVFMPYGPIGLSQSAALAAEDCVELLYGLERNDNHRVWVGRRTQLQEVGGRYTDNWVAEMGDPGSGGLMYSRRWGADAQCNACGGRVS